MSDLPPLEITKKNRRRTGVTLGSSQAGKGDWRRPGENLHAFEAGHDRINWQQPYCPTCVRDLGDCICPSKAKEA